jgi:ADP-heptose:LPS heptosyltransferase
VSDRFSQSPLPFWKRALSIGGPPIVEPGSILVALLIPFGDVVLCQPAVAGLRRRFPRSQLTGLVVAARAPLAALDPDLDDLIVYDDTPEHNSLERLDRSLAAIRERRFDLAVSFSPAGNCVLLMSGIPRQIWHRLPFFFWATGARDPAYMQTHAVELYWQVVAPLGICPMTPEDHIPHWAVSEDDRCQARARLAGLGVDPDAPFAIVHPGAAGHYGRKRWPAERFGVLANRLLDERELSALLVLGGSGDRQAADVIVQATGCRAISLAAGLDFRESAGIVSLASLFVGNDSGTTHLATALGVPTVVITGVSNADQFAPRAADPSKLRVVLPLRPYPPAFTMVGSESLLFLHPQYHPDDLRLNAISVDDVLKAASELLQQDAPVQGL